MENSPRVWFALLCAFAFALPGARADDEVPGDWDDPKPPSKCTSSAYLENRFGYLPPPPNSEPAAAPAETHHAAPGSLFTGDDGDMGQRKPSTLSPDAVQGTVRSHLGEVRFCFQKAQLQNPSLEGRVFVRFTVGPAGQVTASEVESSTLEHPAVEKCLSSAVRRWTFPKPSPAGSATVTWPFKLVALQ